MLVSITAQRRRSERHSDDGETVTMKRETLAVCDGEVLCVSTASYIRIEFGRKIQ